MKVNYQTQSFSQRCFTSLFFFLPSSLEEIMQSTKSKEETVDIGECSVSNIYLYLKGNGHVGISDNSQESMASYHSQESIVLWKACKP